jgi:hypothetical protein
VPNDVEKLGDVLASIHRIASGLTGSGSRSSSRS